MICNSAIYAVQLLSKFSERLRDVCYYHLKVNITGWLAGLIDPPSVASSLIAALL